MAPWAVAAVAVVEAALSELAAALHQNARMVPWAMPAVAAVEWLICLMWLMWLT
jgi:hypothetical protein